MAKKDNKMLIVLGVLAVGGAAWYLYRNKQQAATSPASQPLSPSLLPMPAAVELPITSTVPASIQTAASLSPASPVSTEPAQMPAAGPSEIEVVKQWATVLSPGNLQQFNMSYPSFTQSEWDGLYDLIVNDWEGGQGNTAERVQFWNSWRTKYHINDGTYE